MKFSLLIFREDEGQQKTFREPKHSPQYVMKKYLPITYVLLPVSLDPLDEDVAKDFGDLLSEKTLATSVEGEGEEAKWRAV